MVLDLLFLLFLVFFYNTNRKLINIIIIICFTVLVINIRFFVSDYFTNNNLSGLITFTENPLSLVFTTSNRIIAGINTIYFYFTKFTYISSSKYYYGYNYYDVLSIKSLSFISGLIIITGFIFAFIYSILKKRKNHNNFNNWNNFYFNICSKFYSTSCRHYC